MLRCNVLQLSLIENNANDRVVLAQCTVVIHSHARLIVHFVRLQRHSGKAVEQENNDLALVHNGSNTRRGHRKHCGPRVGAITGVDEKTALNLPHQSMK